MTSFSPQLPAMMPAGDSYSLTDLLQGFLDDTDYLDTSTPAEAFGRCEWMSASFVDYARRDDIPVRMVRFHFPFVDVFPGPYPGLADEARGDSGDPLWHVDHTVAVVDTDSGEYVVDWTLRQLRPGAGYPHVELFSVYAAGFESFEEVDTVM